YERLNYYISVTYFLYNHQPATRTNTLSLHDALPIYAVKISHHTHRHPCKLLPNDLSLQNQNNSPLFSLLQSHVRHDEIRQSIGQDRKSTRLNSSHVKISYAVFCLKKKKIILK